MKISRSVLLNIFLTAVTAGLSLLSLVLWLTDDYYQKRAQLYERLLRLNDRYVGRDIEEVRDSLNVTDSLNGEYYIAHPDLEIPGIEHQSYYGISIEVRDGKVRHIDRHKP